MSIPELAARIKSGLDRVPRVIFLAALLLLTASLAFGFGVLQGRGEGQGAPAITELGTTTPDFMQAAAAAAAAPQTLPAGGEVVASKTGSKYYLPWCGTVKLIKDENKVWFPSKEAAEAAGYAPASNCKGL